MAHESRDYDHWVQRFAVYAVAFASGAVLMSLEIVGSRILAPHFGNSVYVWGSLIGVFLAALSTGYLLGGRIADEWPSSFPLYVIAIAVAVFILGMQYFSDEVCRSFAHPSLGDKWGPLVCSVVLFFVPGVLLGMVSPIAIRLVAKSLREIGKVAGTLYALSTMGSIVGTLATTFFLIPELGTRTILRILAIIMAVMPFGFVLLRSLPWHSVPPMLLVAALGLLGSAAPARPFASSELILYERDSAYHHIVVTDETATNRRYLRFGKYIETGIFLEEPYESVCEYTNLFHLGVMFPDEVRNVLFLGAGGGVGPMSFHRHYEDMRIDVVDIDPRIIELAKRFFFFREDDLLTAYAEDGRMYVRDCRDVYDLIVLDAFTIGGRIPFHLVTKEFFSEARRLLSSDGAFLINVNSSMKGELSMIFRSVYRTMRASFSDVYVFPVVRGGDADEYRSGNVILVGTVARLNLGKGDILSRLSKVRALGGTGMPDLLGYALRLYQKEVDVSDIRLLSDDYAPIETMRF